MNTNLLRQKILDLAIRGKLVPQDPNDEPASVLLERICAEKERLIAEGKIKRPQKAKASSVESHYRNFEPPFPIPDSWEWVKLEDIAYVASGSTPSKESFTDFGIPYLKMYNLRNQKIDFGYHPQYISEAVHNGKLARSRAQSGDLLMNIVGPPLGKLAIVPESIQQCNFNQAAVMIRPYSNVAILNQYLFFYLSEMGEINSIATKGTAGQTNISLTQSQNMRIAVPPLEEIVRINDKITILMSLIEDIENGTYELQHSIISIKYKILELAMHGKLVQQDPMDEPAASMLRRINPKAKIITDNPHYRAIPRSWATVRFTDVCETALGKTLNKGTDLGELRPYLCAVNVKNGYFNLSTIKQAKILPEEFERYSVYKGDLLVCEGGDVGRCAIWQGDRIFYQNALHRIRPLMGIEQKFLKYFLLYAKKRHWIDELCSGVTIKHFTTKAMSNLVIAIPPDNEQIRIIEKLESIFELLNVIEKTLKS